MLEGLEQRYKLPIIVSFISSLCVCLHMCVCACIAQQPDVLVCIYIYNVPCSYLNMYIHVVTPTCILSKYGISICTRTHPTLDQWNEASIYYSMSIYEV